MKLSQYRFSLPTSLFHVRVIRDYAPPRLITTQSLKKGLKGLPIVYNITSPEQGVDDENWKYVRNTPLRKTIESVATFIPIRM